MSYLTELERLQGQMQNSAMAPQLAALQQNVAVIPDGIELAFAGDQCGKSYRIRRHTPGTRPYWDCYFYDWHELGWRKINRWPGEETRAEAIEFCNKHAVDNRLIKFLPHRPKFKPNPNLWGGWGSMASVLGGVAGLGL